jgi:hypothetical protein
MEDVREYSASGVHWEEVDVPEPEPTAAVLAGRLPAQVSRLVRAEASLAKYEAKQRAKVLGVEAGAFGAAGVLLFFAAAATVAAMGLGLANVMRGWLAALVIAAGCVLLAVLIILPGWKGIRDRRNIEPAESLESLKADLNAILDGVHR